MQPFFFFFTFQGLLECEARGTETWLGDKPNKSGWEHMGQLTSRDFRARVTLQAVCHFLSLALQIGHFM